MPINQTSVWNGSQWVTMGGVVDTASNYNWAGSHNFAQSAIFQDDVRIKSLNGGQLAGFRNKIINGGFDVWQRGTSFTFNSAGGYTADRFNMSSGTGGVAVISRQTFTPGQTDVPGNPKYYMQIQHTTDGGTPANLDTRIEDVNTFSGQNATFSFYGKVSSGTAVWTPRLVQFFGTGGSAVNVVMASDITLTTSWQRFTVTFAVPSTSGKTIGEGNYLRPDIYRGTTGVVTYHFANVQFEAGTVATPFEYRPIGTELALCQRYYERISAGSAGYNDPIGWGVAASATLAVVFFPMKVTKRAFTSTVDWSSLRTVNYNTGGTINVTSPSAITATPGGTNIFPILVTTTGMSTGLPVWLDTTGTTGYLGVSAEL